MFTYCGVSHLSKFCYFISRTNIHTANPNYFLRQRKVARLHQSGVPYDKKDCKTQDSTISIGVKQHIQNGSFLGEIKNMSAHFSENNVAKAGIPCAFYKACIQYN